MKATFAAGCFWGIDHTFYEVNGVSETTSGYTGGKCIEVSIHHAFYF